MKTGYLLFSALCLMCAVSRPVCADQFDWRLTPATYSLSDIDKAMIGQVVCGESGYEMTDTGLRCHLCPDFTGNLDSLEGLDIGSVIRGRFTRPNAGMEWLLDTDGCEAHFDSFGGAILLGPIPAKRSPEVEAVTASAAKAADKLPKLIFYKPGFRVNDCLVFDGDRGRNLLVCNEADMAQGEVIGHISMMEISRRGINRWRLLRWYDNSGSDMPEVVSATPVTMRAVAGAKAELLIQVKILETTRKLFDKDPEPSGKIVNLYFQRKGPRFFPTQKTEGYLMKIGTMTRKMLE